MAIFSKNIKQTPKSEYYITVEPSFRCGTLAYTLGPVNKMHFHIITADLRGGGADLMQ